MSEQNATQAPRLPSRWTLARDILSFVGGWVLIFTEVWRPEVRESVLMMAGVAIGFPGIAVGASSITEAIGRRNGTGDSPSEPAQPAGSSSS